MCAMTSPAARPAVRALLASALVGAAALPSLTSASAEPGAPDAQESQRAAVVPAPTAVEEAATTVRLSVAGTYETRTFDEAAAEIVSFDPGTDRLFVVNALSGEIDVLDVSDPTEPTLVTTIAAAGQPLAGGGTVPQGAVVNSVDVHDGVLAVAVQAPDKVDPGWVLFLTADGESLSGVQVGSLPDMLTFTPDGQRVVVAVEAEPAEDFSSDPEGSVGVIDTTGLPEVTQDDVALARFTAYDEGTPLPDGVRVFGPDVPVPDGQDEAGRVARNLEPEYVAVSADSSTAWVSLQEANSIAEVDLATATVSDVRPIPTTDHSLEGNALDPSNRDEGIAIANWPVTGLPMPDTVQAYSAGGEDYLVTANEGDAREWGDYVENLRVGDEDYVLCPDAFGGEEAVAELTDDAALGRLNASTASGLTEAGCYDEIVAFGTRSFSILDAEGERVFDSGQALETEIARLIEDGRLPEEAFNATNDETPSFDNRSDDKGPEPEGLTLGEIGGRTYLFLGLERIGGVMVFDITEPAESTYVTYLNNRAFDVVVDGEYVEGMGDLGPEGLEFISAQDSPTGSPLLAVGNEVSGSTTLYDVRTVAPERLAGADRYQTAARASAGLAPGLDRVYLATGEDFPDGLTGAAAAGAGSTAVLLTRSGDLPGATRVELERLAPEEVVVLGGPAAVSEDVVEQVTDIAPVRRIAGADRYVTAAAVAAELAPGSAVAYVASGADYPDALAASAHAGAQGAPVLLTRPDGLPAATGAALEDLAPTQIVVLGGPEAVSDDVATALEAYAPVQRVAGADRYATAALLAQGRRDVPVTYLATGEAFPDAVAGAALAARTGSPLLLTRADELPEATDRALREQLPIRLVLLGGEQAVQVSAAREAAVRLR